MGVKWPYQTLVSRLETGNVFWARLIVRSPIEYGTCRVPILCRPTSRSTGG
jgi:hypothetical protein